MKICIKYHMCKYLGKRNMLPCEMSLEAYTVINLILSYLVRAWLKWAERQRHW